MGGPISWPTILAIAAVLGSVLVVARALHTPSPVVVDPVERRLPEPPDDSPEPVLAASYGHGWKLDVTDDGVATYVERSWEAREDIRLQGPIDATLVPRLRALQGQAGLVTLKSVPSCLRGPHHTAADDYRSAAAPGVHAEAAELAEAVLHEMHRRRSLVDLVQTDDMLVVVGRRVGRPSGGGSTYELVEVLHAGRGAEPLAPGSHYAVEEHSTPPPLGEPTVATRGITGWFRAGHSPEDVRQILAWLAAHPPTKRRFAYDAAKDTGEPPPL
jgi:hypothetical protein